MSLCVQGCGLGRCDKVMEGRADKNAAPCIKAQIQNAEIIVSPDSSLHMLHLLTSANVLMYHGNPLSRVRKQNDNFYSKFVSYLVSFSLSGVLVRQSQNQVDTFCVSMCSNSLMQFNVPTSEQSLLCRLLSSKGSFKI